MLCSLSMFSGLGTDAILSTPGQGAQKGRGKTRAKGRAAQGGGGRDSASTIADGSRFLNQMQLVDPDAREIASSVITGVPSLTKDRALALLYEILPCTCVAGLDDRNNAQWWFGDPRPSGNRISLARILLDLGLPHDGYVLRDPARGSSIAMFDYQRVMYGKIHHFVVGKTQLC